MATQAAIHEQGVALAPEFLVQDELQCGLLVAPTHASRPKGLGYHRICPEDSASGTELQLFSDWLLAQAQDYLSTP
ncbi:MAG: LysR family transcriptional regulator, partial [Caulobacter sp.]|nr:LysR family transcriptional regulator [Vitreoscilla sp.]